MQNVFYCSYKRLAPNQTPVQGPTEPNLLFITTLRRSLLNLISHADIPGLNRGLLTIYCR